MFIEDLSPDAYLAHGMAVRAIGWLEVGHPYRNGPVPSDFLSKLQFHIDHAYQPLLYRGLHRCSLCLNKQVAPNGFRDLLIPTSQLLYVAPELIVHYVADHEYQPPSEFIDAVFACPKQGSDAFFKMLEPFSNTWQKSTNAKITKRNL